MNPVLVNDNVVEVLNAALADALLFNNTASTGVSAGLYVNNVIPNPQTTLTGLTEAAFTGYARIVNLKTWTVAGVGGGAPIATLDQAVVFASTGPTTPAVTVYGWFLVLPGTPDKLLVACAFDTPFLVSTSHVNIPVLVQLILANGLLQPYPQ